MTEDRARRVQAELEAAQEAVIEHARLGERCDRAAAEVARASAVLADASAAVGVERADVKALESFSTTRIWAGLRGRRESELEREQAELQAAEYAVALAVNRVSQATAEQRAAQAARSALGDVAARRSQALAAKEQWLRETGDPAAAELDAVATEVATVRSGLVEVREAQAAASVALERLGAAGELLEKARGWATYDTYFDGGLLTDMVKYDRMDQAAALMREADDALRRLGSELADVGMQAVGGVEVTELTRTFDVWFDNIFSDWSVRNRITEAAQRTASTWHAVREVAERLDARARELVGVEAALVARREALLA